jgi:serum/glucocorticoid-regulated kinase 2
MLNNSISGPFTDLWALGVIAYQIIVGETPWKGLEYAIFQQILSRKVSFPNNMPLDAVDLIDKLMQLNPLDRLGASGSE